MGGGGAPSAPSPVAVPSAADEAAAEEKARLYSLLRARRAGRGLLYGPRRGASLLAAQKPKTVAGALVGAGATSPAQTWEPSYGGSEGGGGYGGMGGTDPGSGASGGGYGGGGE